jgi:YHS domain-containing protein
MTKPLKRMSFVLAIVAVLAVAGLAQQADENVTCPVSGKVLKKAEAPASVEYEGKTYYFCCEGCKEKFLKDPAAFTKAKAEAAVKYVCPMCKGVESDKSGKCPKCGMDLVKKHVALAGKVVKSCCGETAQTTAAAKKCDEAECDEADCAGAEAAAGAHMKMMAHGAQGCACPMCAADVEVKVENIKDGVSVTLTAKTPEQVKALQDHAAKMKECRAKCLEAKKDAPKK